MVGFNPDGLALPPRRVSAALSVKEVERTPLADSIIVEKARDRLWESFERQLMPQDVKGILASTLSGEMTQWQRLYQAMLDSWPMLQKCIGELQGDAKTAPWRCKPATPKGGQADAAAEAIAEDVEWMIWKSNPRPAYAEGGLEFLIENLVTSCFTGIGVYQPRWENVGGEWRPAAYKPISARYYGYSNLGDGEDRLMLNPEGGYTMNFMDFPEHRFLIAINGGHPGHPTVSAPLRVLTGYWLAAVFGLEWFMKFANLFGVPFRWATYADGTSIDGLKQMMENLGTAGWGVGKDGTKVDIIQPNQSAASLPQAELLKIADEQCQMFILGQTLTSSVGDSGSRALGDVHADTKSGVVRKVCDFVGGIITRQLIPAWSYWNTGSVADNLPEFFPEWPEPVDEKAQAERDQLLGITTGQTPVSRKWFYERHNIPVPADGEEIYVPSTAPTNTQPTKAPEVNAADESGSTGGLIDMLKRIKPTDPKAIEEELERAISEP
jgi:phage gp29-like protein